MPRDKRHGVGWGRTGQSRRVHRVTARFLPVLVRWLPRPIFWSPPVRTAERFAATVPHRCGSRPASARVLCGLRLPQRLVCDAVASRQRSGPRWPDVGQTVRASPRRPQCCPRASHQSRERVQLAPAKPGSSATGRRLLSAKPRARVRASVPMASKGAGHKLSAGERLKWTPEEVSLSVASLHSPPAPPPLQPSYAHALASC